MRPLVSRIAHQGARTAQHGARSAVPLALGLLVAACSSTERTPPATPRGGMTAQVGNYELLADRPNRFMVGLLLDAGGANLQFVSFGTVGMRFSYMGTQESPLAQPEPGPQAEGTFLPVPEQNYDTGREGPAATLPSEGRGLYAAYDVAFDRPGFWQVDVTADIEDVGRRTASAAFEVLAEPLVPAPGQRALRTENLTLESTDAPRAAIDSRAGPGSGIPDEELHRWTIARAIEQGRPALVVFSTPVYCQSQFCGPVTDVVSQLAGEYADRAVFIHVEVWRDFQGGVINKAAADWLLRRGDLHEPWLFLIGADGVILQRWDNLFTREEVEPALQELPPPS